MADQVRMNPEALSELGRQMTTMADVFAKIGAEMNRAFADVFAGLNRALSASPPQLDAVARLAHDRYRRDVVKRIPRRPSSL